MIEMIISLFAMGLSYFKDYYRVFDLIIVTFSIFDIILSYLVVSMNASAVTALRALRIMRIFKLAKTWKELHILISTLLNTLVDISSFSVLLFLFMFIYTTIGRELFANEVKFTND